MGGFVINRGPGTRDSNGPGAGGNRVADVDV
jgi:hypothetical protein